MLFRELVWAYICRRLWLSQSMDEDTRMQNAIKGICKNFHSKALLVIAPAHAELLRRFPRWLQQPQDRDDVKLVTNIVLSEENITIKGPDDMREFPFFIESSQDRKKIFAAFKQEKALQNRYKFLHPFVRLYATALTGVLSDPKTQWGQAMLIEDEDHNKRVVEIDPDDFESEFESRWVFAIADRTRFQTVEQVKAEIMPTVIPDVPRCMTLNIANSPTHNLMVPSLMLWLFHHMTHQSALHRFINNANLIGGSSATIQTAPVTLNVNMQDGQPLTYIGGWIAFVCNPSEKTQEELALIINWPSAMAQVGGVALSELKKHVDTNINVQADGSTMLGGIPAVPLAKDLLDRISRTRVCWHCGEGDARFKCIRCAKNAFTARFCGRECQIQGWGTHKRLCGTRETTTPPCLVLGYDIESCE